MSIINNVESTSETPEVHLSNRIYDVLKHYEGPILHLQRLLVWEDVISSSIFVAVVHIIFYYLLLRSNHFFGIFFFFILGVVWVDCWKHKIWPEIRAVAPDIDSEWGELNPRLLSVKEMCDVLANSFIFILAIYQKILQMRRRNPGKFCLHICFCCLMLMYIGRKISGVFVVYLAILCALIWPVVWYHGILENAYTQIEPFLMQLQYTLQQRPGNTYQMAQSMIGQTTTVVGNDNDIDEFVPPLDEKTAAVLAKAITDESELSETDEEILAHEFPSLSRASTPSSDEHEDELFRLAKNVSHLPDANQETVPLGIFKDNNSSLYLPAGVIADVGNVIKDSFSMLSQSIQQKTLLDSVSAPNESESSTPLSEFEFVDFDPDSKTNSS